VIEKRARQFLCAMRARRKSDALIEKHDRQLVCAIIIKQASKKRERRQNHNNRKQASKSQRSENWMLLDAGRGR